MRPLYETSAHRAVETQMVDRLRLAWRCRAHQLPRAYPLDWLLQTDDGRQRFVECKHRSYSWGTLDGWGGVMLSALKWTHAHALARATGVPFMLVVQVADGTLWWHTPPDPRAHDGVSYLGRTDRDDPDDVEPCVLLRSTRFKPVRQRGTT